MGHDLRRAELFKKPGPMEKAVKDEIANGTPLIIVGGGDGTFGALDHFFARQESVLGVLPLGTGNAFARDLGIKTSLEHACEVIAKGKISKVDLGLLGEEHFLNVATIGLTTQIARNLDKRLKKVFGPLAYLISMYRALQRVEPFDVRLELPDEVAEFRSLQVVLGNGRFHAGPFLIAPDARLTSGKLLAYALESDRKSALLRLAIAVQFGRHVDMKDVRVWRAGLGRISTNPTRTVTVDGEMILETPLNFGVDPKSLRVMTPLDFVED